MTMLHHSSDIEVQAVVLCIPSYDFPDEIEAKAQAHWFSHFYDDHVDRLWLDPDPTTNKVLVEELKAKRQDIMAIVDMLGDLGELCKFVSR